MIIREGVNKSNHPIQNPLLIGQDYKFVTISSIVSFVLFICLHSVPKFVHFFPLSTFLYFVLKLILSYFLSLYLPYNFLAFFSFSLLLLTRSGSLISRN
jgi:hypothetical protein